MSEAIDIIVKEQARAELQGTIVDLEKADKQLLEIISTVKSLNSEVAKIKLPSGFTDTMKRSAEASKQLNAQSEKTIVLEKKVATAKRTVAKLTIKERVEKQAKLAQDKLEERSVNKTLGAYKNLSARLTILRNRYKDLEAKQLSGIKLTKKESQEKEKLLLITRKLDSGIKKLDNSVGQSQRNVGNYAGAFKGLKGTLSSLAGAFGLASGVFLFASLMRDSYRAILQFDSGLKNVSKTTGITGNDLEDLGDEVVKLSRKLEVIGVDALLEYATVAGQLGVKGSEDILAFTEALAKLETASDISGQEGGASIARLLTLTDGGVQNVSDFGDEIVILGNNFAATEKEILNNATAIAQNTGIYKLSRQQVLAYATSTKALGIESEITGSAIGKTLAVLEKSLRQGKNIGILTELTGKNIEELKRLFKDDAGALFTSLITGLNKVDKEGGSVNQMMEELGISSIRHQRVVGSLATAGYGNLERAMSDVENASGSLQTEFETAASKIENQVERLNVAWDNFVVSIKGGAVSEIFTAFIDNATAGMTKLSFALDSGTSFTDKYRLAINHYTSAMSYWIPGVESGKGVFQDFTDALLLGFDALQDVTKELDKQNKAYIKQNGSLAPLLETQEKYIDNLELIRGGVKGVAEDGEKETLNSINKEISELKKQLGEIDVLDTDSIDANKKATKALEKRRDAILGVTKAGKELKKVLKDTIEFHKQEISILEKRRDATATTREAYNSFNEAIDEHKKKIADLNGIREKETSLLKKSIDSIIEYQKALEALNKSIDENLEKAINERSGGEDPVLKSINERNKAREQEAEAIKKIQDENERILKSSLDRFGAEVGIATQTMDELFDVIKSGFEDTGDVAVAFGHLVGDIIGGLADAENARIENKIAGLERERESALSNDQLSARDRERVQIAFDRKIRKLKREQAKNDKEAAVAKAVIDTISAVVEALPNIPLSIAVGLIGAAQTAVIASRPLPEYAKGKKKSDSYSGSMIWGEKQPEVKLSRDGSIEVATSPTVGTTKAGDTIYPSIQEFENSPLQTAKRTAALEMERQGGQLTQAQQNQLDIGKAFKDAIKESPRPKINVQSAPIDYDKLAKAVSINQIANKI